MVWISVVTGLAGVLIGYGLNSRREGLAWLRERRLQALGNLLDQCWQMRRAWDEWLAADPYEGTSTEDFPMTERDLRLLGENFQRAVTSLKIISPFWLLRHVDTLERQGNEMLSFVSPHMTPNDWRRQMEEYRDGGYIYFDDQAEEAFTAHMEDMLDMVTEAFGYRQQSVLNKLASKRSKYRNGYRIMGVDNYEHPNEEQ